MKTVVEYVENRLARHREELRMAKYLADESVPIWERCSWWRVNGTFLHIGIEDMFPMMLEYPDPGNDSGKKMINEYCGMVKGRLPLIRANYLADFNALGLNKVLSFADIVDFLWDEHRESMRRSMYKLAVALYKSEAAHLRYAAIITLRSYAVYYYHIREMADFDYEKETGTNLVYTKFRAPDFTKWDNYFLNIELDGAEKEQAIRNARLMAEAMESAMNENYAFSLDPERRTLWADASQPGI